MSKARKLVDGDDILYRLFVHLLNSDVENVAPAVAGELVQEMSIWLPIDLYRECPVVLPWVVRNPKCRPHKLNGKKYPDNWGAPNERGYQMDDNTLIKAIPKSLPIAGPKDSPMVGKKMGKGFVASHIWRKFDESDVLASRHPEMNSFVANLVWLPDQISKLSNKEGDLIQTLLKHAAHKIYRNEKVRPEYRDHVELMWKDLEKDLGRLSYNGSFAVERALFFAPKNSKFIEKRVSTINNAFSFINSCIKGAPQPTGRITSRYKVGLPKIDRNTLETLKKQVGKFVSS